MQENILAAGLGAQCQRKRQSMRIGWRCNVRMHHLVARAIGVGAKHTFKGGGLVTGWNQPLGQAGVRAIPRFGQPIRGLPRSSAPPSCRAQSRLQAHQRIQTVAHEHHRVDPPQQFTQPDAFVDSLPVIRGMPQVSHVLPVAKGSALIVAPEIRACVQRRDIPHRLGKAASIPVGRSGSDRQARVLAGRQQHRFANQANTPPRSAPPALERGRTAHRGQASAACAARSYRQRTGHRGRVLGPPAHPVPWRSR